MDINLTDSLPVPESYCSIPRKLYDKVKDHIDNLLTNQWIWKSHSAYASPIVYVRKICGGLCLCIDYRKLNNKTIPDKQPILKIQDILDSLGGQEWFSMVDMSKAYHQGYIKEECQKFTAF